MFSFVSQNQKAYILYFLVYMNRFLKISSKTINLKSVSTKTTPKMSVKPEILLFDLDGTLYDAGNGYIEHIRKNIFEFIYIQGFVPRTESAEEFWKIIFKKYNQTFRALKASGYEFDGDEYWRYHRSGMDKFFSSDAILREVLQSFPQKKYIFTNCNEQQAIEALKLLGIDDCFDDIYGSSFMGDNCKPEEVVFTKIFEHLEITDPSKVCLFEDSFKNLVTANKLGMSTVLVESMTAEEEGVTDDDRQILTASIRTLSDLKSLEILKEMNIL